MSDDDTDREQGVNFEPVEPMFEDLSYPVSAADLVDQYGDRELERTSAEPISVGALFQGASDQRFASEEELRQGMLNMMPAESVGRQRYSDRGGSEQENLVDEDEQSTE